MFRNSYCQVSHSLANVINATRTISFVNNFGSVNVFVFVTLLKRLLIHLVCHRIIKLKLKLVNLFSFSINVLPSFSFLPQNGSLMKIFLRSSKRKSGMILSYFDESVRKVYCIGKLGKREGREFKFRGCKRTIFFFFSFFPSDVFFSFFFFPP